MAASCSLNTQACHKPANLLRPLSRLQKLSIRLLLCPSSAEKLLALPALKDLQALQLTSCALRAVPQTLSALT